MKNTLQVKKAAVAVSMALLAAGQAQSAVQGNCIKTL